MSSIFCCDSIKPYKPRYLDHEPKFEEFMAWATKTTEDNNTIKTANLSDVDPTYAVQLVRQVNFGFLESKRYFIPSKDEDEVFSEITEADLIQANFQKLNSFKNWKCADHNKFFEINLYKKDPVNKHHWRADIDRPASSIDL
ncbi:hypothetical protein LTR37_013227 [Vermiconidia calcicola]|uniref:Uncharacterized protein n=1 Tax=Vermiconidia calcicola TaxID=1690605 RepID=A0ACC3MX50_9PEZI|nr:hypothetical protein LTR37_013227 [Vermiconidia calcicola]